MEQWNWVISATVSCNYLHIINLFHNNLIINVFTQKSSFAKQWLIQSVFSCDIRSLCYFGVQQPGLSTPIKWMPWSHLWHVNHNFICTRIMTTTKEKIERKHLIFLLFTISAAQGPKTTAVTHIQGPPPYSAPSQQPPAYTASAPQPPMSTNPVYPPPYPPPPANYSK